MRNKVTQMRHATLFQPISRGRSWEVIRAAVCLRTWQSPVSSNHWMVEEGWWTEKRVAVLNFYRWNRYASIQLNVSIHIETETVSWRPPIFFTISVSVSVTVLSVPQELIYCSGFCHIPVYKEIVVFVWGFNSNINHLSPAWLTLPSIDFISSRSATSACWIRGEGSREKELFD